MSRISIIGKLCELETGVRYARLAVQDGTDYKEVIVSRKDLFANKETLLTYGANVTNFAKMCEGFYKEEKNLQTEFIYKNLGWSLYENQRVFKADKLFGAVSIAAHYYGSLRVQPTGNFEAWRNGIVEYAMPQVALQIAIATGVSALFEGMLADELDSSLILHIKGDSSKGKTTFAMLALSVACSPQSIEGNTLFCGWNSTNNFKLSLLRNNYGYPIVFDEISQVQAHSLTNFVYDIANRQERGRLNSDSSQKDTGTWSTTVISTGEESLLGKCNNNKGLLVRVLEMDFENITADAQSAEALKAVIVNNYGQLYPAILDYIFGLENGIEKLRTRYREIRAQLAEEYGTANELVNRLMKHIAILYLSAEVCSEVLGCRFKMADIKQEFFKAIDEQSLNFNPNETEAILTYLRDSFLANTGKYDIKRRSEPYALPHGYTIGYVTEEADGLRIFYTTEQFQELIKNCPINDKNKALKLLKKGGYLKCEKDRLTKKRIVDGYATRGYEVFIPN